MRQLSRAGGCRRRGTGGQAVAVRPWRPSWRRRSRFSPCAAASAACRCSVWARWRCLSSAICAVSARTTLLCVSVSPTSMERGAGGALSRSKRSFSMRARKGERYRKSIDTPAVLASPRKVIGSRLAISSLSAVSARWVAASRLRCAAARRLSGFPHGISGSGVAGGLVGGAGGGAGASHGLVKVAGEVGLAERRDDLLERALLGQALLEPHVAGGHVLAGSRAEGLLS